MGRLANGATDSGGTGVYFADWPLSTIVARGTDRLKFLHNLCTADVVRLEPERNCEAFFTNVKGHVLAHALISSRIDSVRIFVFQRDASALREHLERYLLRDDVQLSEASDEPLLLVLSPGQDTMPELDLNSAAECQMGDTTVHVDQFSPLGAAARIVESGSASRDVLTQVLEGQGAVSGDTSAFDRLRVEAGWPLAGIDFGEGTLPQELSRDAAAISFTKGCYLGQETVARIDALGHVNKQLVGIKFPGQTPPSSGVQLTKDGKTVGIVTSATYSPICEAPLGLAMVRRGSNTTGTVLHADGRDTEVIELPAVSRRD